MNKDFQNVEKDEGLNYIIPANVNTKFEVFPGIGYKELAYLLAATAIGVMIFLLLGVFKTTEIIKRENVDPMMLIGLTEEELLKPEITITKDVISAPIRLFACATFPLFVYFLFKTDPNTNISFYKQLSYKRIFTQNQRRYLYKLNSGSGVKQ